MKKNLKYFLTSGILMGLLVFSQSCHKHTTSPQEITSSQLKSGVWKVKTVSLDGVDQTSQYMDFALTATQNSYTTTNGGAVWPSSGTWTFAGTNAETLMRDDGVAITIESISGTELVLSFQWNKTTYGGGRVSSTSGIYKFDLEH